MSSERYHVKRTLTGAVVVKYACPNCRVDVNSNIDLAGETDACPECGSALTVPGLVEKKKLQSRKLAEQHAKELDRKKRAEKADTERQARESEKVAARHNQSLAAEESRRQREEQESAAREAERLRLSLLTGQTFDYSNHDWFHGAPYAYDFVEIAPASETAWPTVLDQIINRKAGEGWEYFRSEQFSRVVPPGCLGKLLGINSTIFHVTVLIFRRPAIAIAKVNAVNAQIRG